jgi:hypothetical protein
MLMSRWVLQARSTGVALLLAGAAACSGGGTPSGAPSGYTKIDDMEGSSGFIEWTPPSDMTPGRWVTATDCTEADRIAPPPSSLDPNGWSYAELPAPYETFPGITSAHALRLRTLSPLVDVWGANVTSDFAFPAGGDGGPDAEPPAAADAGPPAAGAPCMNGSSRQSPGVPVDLGAYSGITFWGMSGAADVNVLVQLQDQNTDPRGGICNPTDPTVETNCYNGFGHGVILTPVMTRYTIAFSDLIQDPYWGYHPDPDVLDSQHVYSLGFQFTASICANDSTIMCAGGQAPPASFDFWIDDLYFVQK